MERAVRKHLLQLSIPGNRLQGGSSEMVLLLIAVEESQGRTQPLSRRCWCWEETEHNTAGERGECILALHSKTRGHKSNGTSKPELLKLSQRPQWRVSLPIGHFSQMPVKNQREGMEREKKRLHPN